MALFVSCILFLCAGAARAERFVIEPGDDANASFHSASPMENFDGTTHELSGWIDLDPAALGDSVAVQIEVDLASLDTGMELRDQHMRENHLETDQYPSAIFRGARLVGEHPKQLSKDRSENFTVEGDLSLHGVTKAIRAAIEARLTADDHLDLIARFDVALADFEIARPQFLFMKLAPVQKVTFRAKAAREDLEEESTR